jgi:hypothetical protein
MPKPAKAPSKISIRFISNGDKVTGRGDYVGIKYDKGRESRMRITKFLKSSTYAYLGTPKQRLQLILKQKGHSLVKGFVKNIKWPSSKKNVGVYVRWASRYAPSKMLKRISQFKPSRSKSSGCTYIDRTYTTTIQSCTAYCTVTENNNGKFEWKKLVKVSGDTIFKARQSIDASCRQFLKQIKKKRQYCRTEKWAGGIEYVYDCSPTDCAYSMKVSGTICAPKQTTFVKSIKDCGDRYTFSD